MKQVLNSNFLRIFFEIDLLEDKINETHIKVYKFTLKTPTLQTVIELSQHLSVDIFDSFHGGAVCDFWCELGQIQTRLSKFVHYWYKFNSLQGIGFRNKLQKVMIVLLNM